MKNRNKRITAKILVMTLLMSMLSLSGMQVSAGWGYEECGFRWECDDPLVHRLFNITYDVKFDEDENIMYVNTKKPFTLVANRNGGHVVVESDAEFGISFYSKTTDGKPVITINKGVTATIYAYGRSTVEATQGPAIYNEGTLKLVSVDGATLNVIGGEGGSAISGPGALNITDIDLTVKGGKNGAGIENSAASGSAVTISNSKVTAEGGEGGAAIGGASGENSGIISISNSTVTAKGGLNAAAIGGGCGGAGGYININFSMITAEGGDGAADIGGGANNSSAERITVDANSTVKASEMGRQPQNAKGENVKLFAIDNPNSANVMIDGKLFPHCNHFNEKKVYAYLTDTEHNIEVINNRFGDFVVTGYDDSFNPSNIIYDTYNHTLKINTSAPLEIANINPMQATGDRVIIASGVAANVTLAGVNILQEADNPAFEIEYNSAANVTVNLKEGTNNFLTGGVWQAGLQKSQGGAQEFVTQGHGGHAGSKLDVVDRPVETGTLTIRGEGKLWATGGLCAPGIGSNYGSAVENIVIESGNIVATGGDDCSGIGGKMGKVDSDYFAVGNIEIRGGNLRVVGGKNAPAIGGVSVPEQKRGSSIKIWSYAKVEAVTDSPDIPILCITVYNELGREVVPIHISNPNNEEIYFDNYDIGSTERGYELFATKEIHSVQAGDTYKFYEYDDTYQTFREFTPDANYNTGDFTVTGGVPCADYYYKDGILYIRSSKTPVAVKNTNPNKATTDRIIVKGSSERNFILDGVNIETEDGKPALFIENGIKANVNITLAENSVNVLSGGNGCAALDKTGGEGTGELHINGMGALYALGGTNGAGIGSSAKNAAANIYIDGGCITAIGGDNAYDIGSGFAGTTSVLRIAKEASVKVNNTGCTPYIIRDGLKTDLALLKIYNPDGKDVYINDGENDFLLPFKKHLGGEDPEDHLYTYLPGGAYGVKLGIDGTEEEFTVNSDTGDFVVSGYGTSYTNGVLTINTKDRIIISNKNPDAPTTDCIYIPEGINANITLAGVNIKSKSANGGIKIDDNHTGKVTLTLADTTQNNIVSEFSSIPGILMQNVDCTLEIKGNGSLNVAGGGWAPGIGSSTHGQSNSSFGAGTFIISGGKITAKGYDIAPSINPGIGYCLEGYAEPATTKKIVISENASVNATLGTAPENPQGEKVYLYTVENPDKENIFVNGKPYPHINQSKDDSNVYLYLPAMRVVSSGTSTSRVDNKITVGTVTDYVHYENNEWVQNGHFEFSVKDMTYSGEEQIPFTIEGTVPDNTTVSYSTDRYGVYTSEIPKFKEAGNYTVWCSVSDIYGTQISPINVEIKRATLNVTANPNTITYGDEPSDGGVTYEGFVNGENKDVLSGALDYSIDYEKWADAGTYTITPFGLTSDNYEIIFETGELTVNKKELSKEDVTVQNSGTVIYDGEPHTAYVSLSENRSGVGKITVKYTKDGTSFIDKPTEAGTYDIYVTASGGTNYQKTQGNGVKTGKTIKIIEATDENTLLLNVSGKAFLVTPSGKDKDKGVVIAALYDSEKMNRLLEVKLFDIEKGEIPFGVFEGNGSFIKAMWWSALSTMTPFCEAKCYPPVEAIPTPTPGGGDSGYNYDDYGGGDSGGGIADFGGGGSGGQSIIPDSLPQPSGAHLVFDSSNNPLGVDMIEGVTLKEDGTINSTNINFANDKNLAKAVSESTEILKKDCRFSKQLCLAVFNKSGESKSVKIKLNNTYKNKKAYIFCYDKKGDLVYTQSGGKYITKILSSPDFDNDILSMDLEPFETVIIGFGIK